MRKIQEKTPEHRKPQKRRKKEERLQLPHGNHGQPGRQKPAEQAEQEDRNAGERHGYRGLAFGIFNVRQVPKIIEVAQVIAAPADAAVKIKAADEEKDYQVKFLDNNFFVKQNSVTDNGK